MYDIASCMGVLTAQLEWDMTIVEVEEGLFSAMHSW